MIIPTFLYLWRMIKLTNLILRGFGQIMLQNNPYTGLLFLVGILYNSWLLALAAIAGCIISTATAYVLKFDIKDIEKGIYGFNGALTAIAIYYFFGFNILSTALLVVGSSLSSILQFQIKRIINPYTAPFILVTWILLFIVHYLFKQPLVSINSIAGDTSPILLTIGNSFGQVFLQENWISGTLIFIGILINSPKAALYALVSVLLSTVISKLVSLPDSQIYTGLIGYNATLCAIAFSDSKRMATLWIILSVFLSLFIFEFIGLLGVIPLTASFVITTWVEKFFMKKVKI